MTENSQVQFLLLWIFIFILPSLIVLRIMIRFRVKTEFFYITVFLIFVIASILRFTGLYPGKHEPVWVDIATAFISLFSFFILKKSSYSFRNILSHIPFLIIITSPHCMYIITGENIGHPWYINL